MKANWIDFKERFKEPQIDIKQLLKQKVLILDWAMGTQLQKKELPKNAWDKKTEGCNELLNTSSEETIKNIHLDYIKSWANIIKTNTFWTSPWTLEEYGLENETYELSFAWARIAKEACLESSENEELFVAWTIWPGSKIPSFNDISYDEMYDWYKNVAKWLIQWWVDLFLLETCQDPLQIKVALHACLDISAELKKEIPVMVSITIEDNDHMLIWTDVETIANILDGFDILSVGFNCWTWPEEVAKHVDELSKLTNIPISIHANAWIPKNIGWKTIYPMEDKEFSSLQKEFLDKPNVWILGWCCWTTPEHIKKLREATCDNIWVVIEHRENKNNFVSSLFKSVEFKSGEVLLIWERCNATGSRKFKEMIEGGDIEQAIEVAKQQIVSGASIIDINVEIPGLIENENMQKIIKEFRTKILLPLMIDSTNPDTIENALKLIGWKPIINSVNLENWEEDLEKICKLAKRYNTSLVCLVIDEKWMAKTKDRKIEVATRIYDLAVWKYWLKPKDLIFDLLAFTVWTWQETDKNVWKETIEAIAELTKKYPEVNTTLWLSNISHGLDRDARKVLNSVFLDICKEAWLTSAIVDVKHIIPIVNISENDIKVCEDLLLNKTTNALFDFIEHFSDFKIIEERVEDFEKLTDKQKINKLLKNANTSRLIELLDIVRTRVSPNIIINEILIDVMKEIGVLFWEWKMQMPFVLASAETMKKCVDFLNPYLDKSENTSSSKLILWTVKWDVHDVGKNLTDIILSNNWYDITDIWTRAEIDQFVELIEQNKGTKDEITAIGFSWLLVKSTNVMLENLKFLEENSINIPVLLWWAALNRKFVEEFCKPVYSWPVFYCKDAFDGIEAMKRIEKSIKSWIELTKIETDLHPKDDSVIKVKRKKIYAIPKYEDLELPEKKETPKSPFLGRKVLKLEDIDELAFDWLGKRLLFSHSWGYNGKWLSKVEKESQKIVLEEKFQKYKKEILEKSIFEPVMIYWYFPCKADKDNLIIYNPEDKKEILYTLKFPRHNKPPFNNLSDYFRDDKFDILPLSIVSAWSKFSKFEKELFDNWEFLKYNEIHWISINLAESLADIVHKQIRKDLNILDKEKWHQLSDIQRIKYNGARYSFWYNACPNLEDNQVIFDLLKPEEFWITLSETFQMHPEQTTSALIVHHEEAKYW